MFDQKLTYKHHIAKAAKRGIQAALALKRLKNLKPEISRLLFTSTVAPVVDYASPIWAPSATQSSLCTLDTVQRIGAQAVIGGFRTVARCVAESEAGIEPVSLRHHRQQRTTWIKWHTKPVGHCFWKVKTALSLNNKRWILPLQKIAQKFEKLDVSSIEKIRAYARNPLTNPVEVLIPDNKKHAADLAKQHKGVAAFVDSSLRNDLVGIGIYWQGIP